LGGWAVMAGFLFGVIAGYVTLFKDLKSLNQSPPKSPTP
jgi:hypothetical protein